MCSMFLPMGGNDDDERVRDAESEEREGGYNGVHDPQRTTREEEPREGGFPRRGGVPIRPPRAEDLRIDEANDAGRAGNERPPHVPGGGSIIDATVFAQLTSQLEQHLHVPLQMPDQERLERMKSETPEAYQVWLRVVDRQSKTDANLRELPYRMPYKVARLGQICGLVAVLALLALAGYIASLGSPGWAFGTGLTGVIGLAAVFNGARAQEGGP